MSNTNNSTGMQELNAKVSLEFLMHMHPEGPWCLAAIDPNKKGIETDTFYAETEVDCAAFIDKYNGNRNLYWHVNPVLGRLKKKAVRKDIKEVCYLHVDIDPGAQGTLQSEQDAILEILTDKLPKGVPEPTTIVFSGGGFQAFWKLKEPIPINGDIALAEDAKLYSKQLETLFGADNCHNIDRLMRLPGSMNIPDERKRKKGRVETLATVTIPPSGSRVYDIGVFNKAPVDGVANAKAHATSGAQTDEFDVDLSGGIEKVASLDRLDEWNVPLRIKSIIEHGLHPDPDEQAKKNDNSRSAWLFDVVCGLLRCDVPDGIIAGIILHPNWKISESVLDKKTGAQKYVIQQIGRAKIKLHDPVLADLNEQHMVIKSFGGKCVVVSEVYDHVLNRYHIERQSFGDFRNAYLNQKVEIGTNKDGTPKYEKMGKWWLEHPKRREFDRVVFKPDGEGEGEYNLWKGFGVTPQPGYAHLSFLGHLYRNLCGKDPEKYRYLVQWMAVHIQHPAQQGHVAVVIRGSKGTGKSFFGVHFGNLFGSHFWHVTQEAHVTGQFNSHLRHTKLLFVDEALNPNVKKHDSILKTLITEQSISCEAKGVDVELVPNYLAIIMASNEVSVVRATEDERRYFVLEANDAHMQDTYYFGGLCKDLKAGGYESLLNYLQTIDLNAFNIRSVPRTNELEKQIAETEGTPYDDSLDYWLSDLAGAIHPHELHNALRLNKPSHHDKIELGKSMRKRGWERRRLRCDDRNTAFWCKGDSPEKNELIACVNDNGKLRTVSFEPKTRVEDDIPF